MNIWKNGRLKEKLTLKLKITSTKTWKKCYKCSTQKYVLPDEPESLKSMLAALDRHLKEHDYKYSIIQDQEFSQSKLVLEGKIKHLHQQAKGKGETNSHTESVTPFRSVIFIMSAVTHLIDNSQCVTPSTLS